MTTKLPINLENLRRQWQVGGERIEYKAGWNPDAILRTLRAFANDFENLGGGYVVIGQDCDATWKPPLFSCWDTIGRRDVQQHGDVPGGEFTHGRAGAEKV